MQTLVDSLRWYLKFFFFSVNFKKVKYGPKKYFAKLSGPCSTQKLVEIHNKEPKRLLKSNKRNSNKAAGNEPAVGNV